MILPCAILLQYIWDDKQRAFHHVALSREASFKTDAMFITSRRDDKIEERDPVTELYPFVIAASAVAESDLFTIYHLLRRNPSCRKGGGVLKCVNLSRPVENGSMYDFWYHKIIIMFMTSMFMLIFIALNVGRMGQRYSLINQSLRHYSALSPQPPHLLIHFLEQVLLFEEIYFVSSYRYRSESSNHSRT